MKHLRVLILALMIAGSASISSAQQVTGQGANVEGSPKHDLLADALGLERYPVVDLRADLGETLVEGERDLVFKSMNAVREVIRLRARDKDNIGRGDHAKSLGCYEAEFTVSPPGVVAATDQAGISARENLGRTFPAQVRFSNSEPKDVSDYRSATVGLAVKVKLDPAEHPKEEFFFDAGTAQDFVAGGLDTFVSRNIIDYADLFRLRIHPFANVLTIIDQHPKAFAVFGKEPLLRLFSLSSSTAPMVLEKRFSSLLPYAWGNTAVKFRFEPCHTFDRGKATFSRFDDSYQAKVIAEYLESHEICYLMKIQARPRPASDAERALIDRAFPLDDATAYWPEAGVGNGTPGAEFHEVARVRIKRSTRAMDDRDCERLAFNPWNGLKAHQPLGSLSRARAAVYKASELARKDLHEAAHPQ